MVSAIFVTLDSTTSLLIPSRQTVDLIVSPIFHVAKWPYSAVGAAREQITSHSALLERIKSLERELLALSRTSQQIEALQVDNNQMRALLNSRPQAEDDALIAEVVGIPPVPSVHQVVIDKGVADGVNIGHAVLDAKGLIGQVVQASQFNSRVLLITDSSHSLPVQVVRTGVRGIANGSGQIDLLQVEGLSMTADIRAGDNLIASGLGGRFPYGHPVAQVQSVQPNPTGTLSLVNARPSAQLDRVKYVLVILNKRREVWQ